MLKKTLLGVTTASLLLMTGCHNEIQNMEAMTLEEVAGSRLAQMSNDEKEGLIYQFVSDRIVVDKENLIKIDDKDLQRINQLLDHISKGLKGERVADIKEEYANYLLMEFARTPYEWEQKKVEAVGFDPAARLFFVDVTYSTTNNYKRVIPSSKIPKGSPEEEIMKQTRYKDYIAYLDLKRKGDEERSNQALAEFERAWGSVASINQEQQGVSLLARTQLEDNDTGGIGKLTYTGLIQDSTFNKGSDMTVRYVMSYKYNLGEETDLEVVSLYLKEYELKNSESIIENLSRGNASGVEVLKPFVDKLIVSYHKAVEESNEQGLYKLYYDYADIDKYYYDIDKYTYTSIGGYNFEILQRNGTNLVVKVNRINQIRAKGAEMSLPTYEEELIYNLVMDEDDTIKIRNVNLVKSTMVGEPLSVIKNVSGVSDLIQYSGESFTATNEEKVEEAIKKFSKVVFSGKVDTREFAEIVDVGVSETTLRKITDFVTSAPDADRKLTYIVSWDTKTNVFASLTLREIFEKEGGNLDTESVVDLVNRNGEWRVVNYTRTLSIKTSDVKIDAKNALTVDE